MSNHNSEVEKNMKYLITIYLKIQSQDLAEKQHYHGIKLPWIQVKLLKIFSNFIDLMNDKYINEITEILEKVYISTKDILNTKTDEHSINSQLSIYFESIQLLMNLNLPENSNIFELFTIIFHRIITINNYNIKYLAFKNLVMHINKSKNYDKLKLNSVQILKELILAHYLPVKYILEIRMMFTQN